MRRCDPSHPARRIKVLRAASRSSARWIISTLSDSGGCQSSGRATTRSGRMVFTYSGSNANPCYSRGPCSRSRRPCRHPLPYRVAAAGQPLNRSDQVVQRRWRAARRRCDAWELSEPLERHAREARQRVARGQRHQHTLLQHFVGLDIRLLDRSPQERDVERLISEARQRIAERDAVQRQLHVGKARGDSRQDPRQIGSRRPA